jgi:hypothetical protein
VPVELRRGRGAVHCISETAEEVADHRVVPLERAQHGGQVRVCLLDRGKQGAVFAAVVTLESCTEAVAVDQQVTARLLGRNSVAHGPASEAQRVADAPMYGA